MTRAALISLLLAWVPLGALACTPAVKKWYERTKTAADCSFRQAGRPFEIAGDASVDLGRGRVGQVVYDSFGVSLLVADCNTQELIDITPPVKADDIAVCGPSRDIDAILPPRVDYADHAQMSDVLENANAAGLRTSDGYLAKLDSLRRRDRFDPFCGCAMFYPGSEGAM